MLRRYLASAGLARLADEMVAVTVVLFVKDRTGSVVLAGAAVAAYTLPSILSGPLLGAWLDRTRRPLLALAGNQFLLAAGTAGLTLGTGRMPFAVVVGLAVLTGVTLPMTSGGFTSLVPRLVSDNTLPRANTCDALLFNVAAIGGPALAGILTSAFGATSAMTAISALATVGGLWTTTLRLPRRETTRAEATPLFVHVRRGLAHLARTPPLRGATLATVLSLGAVGTLGLVLPLHVESLGVDVGATGFVWAAIEAGGIIGVVLLRRHLHLWRPENTVFVAIALYGLVMATWPLARGLPALLALALLSGLVQGPTLTSIITARQRYSPADLLSQVSTTGASLKMGAFALGAAVGGPLVAGLGTRTVIVAVAVAQLAAALLGRLTGTPRAVPVANCSGTP